MASTCVETHVIESGVLERVHMLIISHARHILDAVVARTHRCDFCWGPRSLVDLVCTCFLHDPVVYARVCKVHQGVVSPVEI